MNELEEAKEKVKQLEKEAAKEEAEILRREKAIGYFDKHFGLDIISDNYNIYPQEQWFSKQSRFADEFVSEDDEDNAIMLTNLRDEYIDYLEEDIKLLQNELTRITVQNIKLS